MNRSIHILVYSYCHDATELNMNIIWRCRLPSTYFLFWVTLILYRICIRCGVFDEKRESCFVCHVVLLLGRLDAVSVCAEMVRRSAVWLTETVTSSTTWDSFISWRGSTTERTPSLTRFVCAQPAYTQPAYIQPAYTQPTYIQPAYIHTAGIHTARIHTHSPHTYSVFTIHTTRV